MRAILRRHSQVTSSCLNYRCDDGCDMESHVKDSAMLAVTSSTFRIQGRKRREEDEEPEED